MGARRPCGGGRWRVEGENVEGGGGRGKGNVCISLKHTHSGVQWTAEGVVVTNSIFFQRQEAVRTSQNLLHTTRD